MKADSAAVVVENAGEEATAHPRALEDAGVHGDAERALATLAAISDGVIRTDVSCHVDFLNPVAERLTGWQAQDAIGRPLSEVFPLVDELTRKPLADSARRCLAEGVTVEPPGPALLTTRSGDEISVRGSMSPIVDRHGRPLGAVLVFRDVTELRGVEREMVYLASHDALTGLPNRREFEGRLKRALRTARAEQRPHVLLYLDLDQFKIVNDTCGHPVGDEMLKQVTGLLRSRVRRSDVLARIGGDEFGVLLEDCPVAQAQQIAEEMRRAVREFRFSWRDQLFEVGVSIGLVPIDADSGDLGHLMSAADAACYMAKDGGRNRVHSYEQDDTTLAERYGQMQWIQRIESALAERRFRLFYQMIQPVEGEASGRELLCEILLRMLDRKGQLIESSAFLSAAERYHLITRLDRWVITTAFAALVEARRHTDRPNVLFALNVSAQSIADETFLPFLVEALASSSVEPRRVAFEITESAAIGKLDLVQHLMATLGELGCRFILDGFGSGLSSLAYLRNLSFDFLKIDGELVQHLGDDPVQRAMVESIHQVGHAMGMRTIAQWVETRHHFDTLRAMGIDYAQGHWLGRPQAFVHDV